MKKINPRKGAPPFWVRPPIRVFCGECHEWYNEQDTKFLDIEEDIQRADVVTFICPKGHDKQRSRRIG